MGESGRMPKVSAIVATLCIIIYVLAISSSVVQIIENIGLRRSLAESEFYDLADRATQSAVFLGFMSEPYQDSIKDFISGSQTLLGAIISGSGGEYAFERQAGSGIVWAGSSPRFKTNAFQSEPLYLPLRVDGQRNVNIQAIYSRIDNVVFLRILRNTLLTILAGLAIALLTLLIELTRKSGPAYRRPLHTPQDEKNFHARESAAFTEAAAAETADEYAEEEAFDEIAADEAPAVEDTAEEETIAEGRSGEQHDDQHPTGLYTPRGNIGWESYTHDRLASELHRCASFEQDLVYLAMELKNNEKPDDALYHSLAEEAVKFFASRDLVFEKGENGLSIIIPNINLEQGMAKSEEFRGETIARLSNNGSGRNNGMIDLCIGLSSRSGRLMEARRLILETDKALEKAMADPVSPIIAFKSDPEKYREYIKEH